VLSFDDLKAYLPIAWDYDNTCQTEILTKKRYNSIERTFPGRFGKAGT
jgi:urate oxidase